MKSDGKNKFYRLLKVDAKTMEAIKLFRKFKKEILSNNRFYS